MNNINVDKEMKEINDMIGDNPFRSEREFKMIDLLTGVEVTIPSEDLTDKVEEARKENLTVLFSMKCPDPLRCMHPGEEWHHGVVVTKGQQFCDPRMYENRAEGLRVLGLVLGGGDNGEGD